MKFETHFNEQIFRRQTNLLFDLLYKNRVDRVKQASFFGVICIVIGYAVGVVGKMNLGYFFMAVGAAAVAYYTMSLYQHRSRRKGYKAQAEAQIPEYQQYPVSCWEFNHIYFKFSDCSGEYCFTWNEILGYKVADDVLFLFGSNNMPFILGACEVDKETYNAIVRLVESKVII